MKIEKLVCFVFTVEEMREALFAFMKKKGVDKHLIKHAKENCGDIEYYNGGYSFSVDNVAEVEKL